MQRGPRSALTAQSPVFQLALGFLFWLHTTGTFLTICPRSFINCSVPYGPYDSQTRTVDISGRCFRLQSVQLSGTVLEMPAAPAEIWKSVTRDVTDVTMCM